MKKSEFAICKPVRESTAYKPLGTLNLKMHRNGLLELDENVRFPERRKGFEMIGSYKENEYCRIHLNLIRTEMKEIDTYVARQKKYCKYSSDAYMNCYDKLERLQALREECASIAKKLNEKKVLFHLPMDGLEIEDYFELSVSAMKGKNYAYIMENGKINEKNRILKNRNDSVTRTEKILKEYAFNNPWNYVATFTIDSEKCDRYSFDECRKKLSQLLNTFHKRFLRAGGTEHHLLIPEQHKDGAFHFHGFFYLEGSDALLQSQFSTIEGHTNLKLFYDELGFSEIEKIRNPLRSAKYVSKYIKKQMGRPESIREMFPFARLLMCSKVLNRSVRLELLTLENPSPETVVDEKTGENRSICYYKVLGELGEKKLSSFFDSVAQRYEKESSEVIRQMQVLLSDFIKKHYFFQGKDGTTL